MALGNRNRNNNNNNNKQDYQLIDSKQYEDMMKRAQQQAADAAKPDRPAWEAMLGADGLIKQPYQVTDQYNTGALDQMRQEGMRAPGEQSQFRQLQEAKLAGVNAAAQGQTQSAMNQLAMKGGLRSGSAERMAMGGANNALAQGQNMRLDLDQADEQQRLQGLGALNQVNLQAAGQQQGVQQTNISNSLADITQKRFADLESYKEELRAWGSEKTAAATPSGGKK